jgi:hypothetical protein
MALDVAQELQLKAVRLQSTYGAGGLHQNEVFEAVLTISIVDPSGSQLSIGGEIQAMAVPRLGEYFQAMGASSADPFPARMIGLVGRDLLRHATLVYEGSKGSFEFKVDVSSLQQDVGSVLPHATADSSQERTP